MYAQAALEESASHYFHLRENEVMEGSGEGKEEGRGKKSFTEKKASLTKQRRITRSLP